MSTCTFRLVLLYARHYEEAQVPYQRYHVVGGLGAEAAHRGGHLDGRGLRPHASD